MERVRPKPELPASRTGLLCKFCDHYYLMPCDEERSRTCPNTKKAKTKKVKRK